MVVLHVDPGICGFSCTIRAERKKRRSVQLEIVGSECAQIRALAKNLPEMSMTELFIPLTANPVFIAAEEAGCHLSCPVPTALIKAAEAAIELALPKEVVMRFADRQEEVHQ
jgi:hypothetical protein